MLFEMVFSVFTDSEMVLEMPFSVSTEMVSKAPFSSCTEIASEVIDSVNFPTD